MDETAKTEVLRQEIEKLRQLASRPNELGQVLIHHTHLRGIAAQLENVLLRPTPSIDGDKG